MGIQAGPDGIWSELSALGAACLTVCLLRNEGSCQHSQQICTLEKDTWADLSASAFPCIHEEAAIAVLEKDGGDIAPFCGCSCGSKLAFAGLHLQAASSCTPDAPGLQKAAGHHRQSTAHRAKCRSHPASSLPDEVPSHVTVISGAEAASSRRWAADGAVAVALAAAATGPCHLSSVGWYHLSKEIGLAATLSYGADGTGGLIRAGLLKVCLP